MGVPVPEQRTAPPACACGWPCAVLAHLSRLSALSALSGQAAAAIQRGIRLRCRRRARLRSREAAVALGNLQLLENPVEKCSLRELLAKASPLRSGDVWPVSRPRMRKSASGPRWPWPMCP